MPISIPTLAITDNEDGTVTATLSGGDSGATNTVYTQPADGNLATSSWTSRGSRTGNGTVGFSLDRGVYWFRANTTLLTESYDATLAYKAITDGELAMHERIIQAVVSRIQALTLAETDDSPGAIGSSQVLAQMIGESDAIALPAVLVTPEEEAETVEVLTNARDDWGYPVRVAIVDRSSANYTASRPKYLRWREQIGRAFQGQRLAGLTEAFICQITPAKIIDARVGEFQTMVSGLTLRFKVRQSRGLT